MEENKTNLKIVPFKNNRFIIVHHETGEIIDDVQGYGYKTIESANKALWWKYKNGKEKIEKEKNDFKEWISDSENKKLLREIEELFEINFKELMRGEIKGKDIFKEIEKRKNIQIPKFVKKSFN
jgi:hypothetical protein